MDEIKQTIDSLFQDFSVEGNETQPKAQINIWVPAEYKHKFDLLQARSNKKFGKILQKMVRLSIDNIELEA